MQQTVPTQNWPPGQLRPKAPRLVGSVLRFTHRPLQIVWLGAHAAFTLLRRPGLAAQYREPDRPGEAAAETTKERAAGETAVRGLPGHPIQPRRHLLYLASSFAEGQYW